MITRIEIDGFKTFRDFSLDLRPFSAIVGANATGKSNLFDALRFISLLAQGEILSAMQQLRGEPDELFRRENDDQSTRMTFAVEVLLPKHGSDAFGTDYEITSQRLRYEVSLALKSDNLGLPYGIFVDYESCRIIPYPEDTAEYGRKVKISRSHRKTAFLETEFDQHNSPKAFIVRQDGLSEGGATRRGSPQQIPASEASRTALSTISTADFRHLYALRHMLIEINFLEINPQAARRPSDRFEKKKLRSDASNLAAALAELNSIGHRTGSSRRPLADLSSDLSYLIPSVKSVRVRTDEASKEYAFDVVVSDGNQFSSRVISDGTLRLLALLAVINSAAVGGILCFEEPENGVHEGRIPALVQLLRGATTAEMPDGDFFQIILNTHSPAVLRALELEELVLAEMVSGYSEDRTRSDRRTRMRRYMPTKDLFDRGTQLSKHEVEAILKRPHGHV